MQPTDTSSTIAVAPGGRLWIEGDSTLHRYQASAGRFAVRFQASPVDGELLEVAIREKRIAGLEVEVPVSALSSGDAGLDETLRDALKATAHPQIRFRLESYDATPDLGLHLHGKLQIAGETRAIHFQPKVERVADGLRLTGTVPLLMTSYGIKPPAKMLGMLKAADRVEVKFDLRLTSSAGAPSPAPPAP